MTSFANSRFLIVVSTVFILFAVFSFWVSNNIYDPGKFNQIVISTYEEPEVRNAIANEMVSRALNDRPIVRQAVGDSMQSFISGMLGSQAFKSILERVSTAFQRYLLSDNRQDVVLDVSQIQATIKPVITAISPGLESQLPDINVSQITLVSKNSLPQVGAWLGPIVAIGPIVGFLGLAYFAYAFYSSSTREAKLKEISLSLGIGSFLVLLLIPYFRMLVEGSASNQNMSIILVQLYNNFTEILMKQLLILLLIAVIFYLLAYFSPQIQKYVQKKTSEK